MFSNSNLKPSKLKEHFQNKHGGESNGHDIQALKVKGFQFYRAGTLPQYGFSPIDKPLLQGSYHIAYNVAKSKKPHAIVEELIKPCAEKKPQFVLGKEAANKLS